MKHTTFSIAGLLLLVFGLVIVSSCQKDPEPSTLSFYISQNMDVGPINIQVDNSLRGAIYPGDVLAAAPSCGNATVDATFSEAGSHSYRAVSADGSEWSGTVTLGEGDCKLINLTLATRTYAPAPTNTKGELLFWEESTSGCSGTTEVSIGGITKYITVFSNGAPSCGSSGNATFSLDAGVYTYTAYCSGVEKTGTVTVTADDCTPVRLDWNNNPPSGQGEVVFWESSSSGCTATSEVTINGITKQISTFSASAPSCGSAGNATFTLAPGSYSYTAYCSGTTKTGTVAVYANQCTPAQLNWGSTNSTGQVVFWESSSSGCTATTEVTINGITKQVSTFSSSAPSCGSAGSATFTLAPGSYSYTAYCSGTTKTGTVTVYANQCTPAQLNWSGGNNGTGQATFWVRSDFGCGPITVNINGTTRTINSYYNSSPACGASGCANYTLNPGVYPFTASCDGYNWNGSVSVTSGGCLKMELTL